MGASFCLAQSSDVGQADLTGKASFTFYESYPRCCCGNIVIFDIDFGIARFIYLRLTGQHGWSTSPDCDKSAPKEECDDYSGCEHMVCGNAAFVSKAPQCYLLFQGRFPCI